MISDLWLESRLEAGADTKRTLPGLIIEVLAQHHAVCTIGVNGRQRSANAFEEV